jgi:hypothetical protein
MMQRKVTRSAGSRKRRSKQAWTLPSGVAKASTRQPMAGRDRLEEVTDELRKLKWSLCD